MTEQLNEGTLIAPTFTGSDSELSGCTNAWSSIINSLNYTNWFYSCEPVNSTQVQMSKENKLALYGAIISFCQSKMSELEQLPQTTATIAAQATSPTQPESYAEESKKEDKKALTEENKKFIQRMRELAGVPHQTNRV